MRFLLLALSALLFFACVEEESNGPEPVESCMGGKCDNPDQIAPTITEGFLSWASFYDGEFAGFAAGLADEYLPIDGHELTLEFYDVGTPEDLRIVTLTYGADVEHYSTAQEVGAFHDWTELHVVVHGAYELDYVRLEFAIRPGGCDYFSSLTCFADFNVINESYFSSIEFFPGEHAGFIAVPAMEIDGFDGSDFVVMITRPERPDEPFFAQLEYDVEANDYRTGALEEDFTSWEELDVIIAGFEGDFFIRVDFKLLPQNCDDSAVFVCYPDYAVAADYFEAVGLYPGEFAGLMAIPSQGYAPHDGHTLEFSLVAGDETRPEFGTLEYRADEERYVSTLLETSLTSFSEVSVIITGALDGKFIRLETAINDLNCDEEAVYVCYADL